MKQCFFSALKILRNLNAGKCFPAHLLSTSSLAPDFPVYSSNSPEVAFKMRTRGFIVNFAAAASLWLF